MNVMIDVSIETELVNLLDESHKITKFSTKDMPDMPYDRTESKSLIAQWLYSKAVDHDVDVAIVADVDVSRWMNKYGIQTLSLV
jgi:hypothetical protein